VEACLTSRRFAFAILPSRPSPTPTRLVAVALSQWAAASADPHTSFLAHHRTEEIGGGPFHAGPRIPGVEDGGVADVVVVGDAARDAVEVY
jgi:hypothetical protein